MKKIDVYVTKRFIKSIFLSLFAFIGIFILSRIFKVISYITSDRLTTKEGAIYMVALIPDIIGQIMPLAVLLGGLITINKMATTLEVIALKTSGISFKRIILYPIIITFFISTLVFYLNNTLKPEGLKISRELKRKNQIGDDEIPIDKENIFLRGDGDYIYHFDYVNRKTKEGKGIEIVELNKEFNRIESIITAKLAKYTEDGHWVLYNVNENNTLERKVTFYEEYERVKYKEEPELFLTPKYREEELKFGELRDVIELLNKTGGEVRAFEVEFAKRVATPFASIFMGILGLALGSRYVRGSSAISIALSVTLGYGYYIVQASFEALAMGGSLSVLLGMWIPNIIFIIIGIISMNKAEY